jgi:hypothetical protein
MIKELLGGKINPYLSSDNPLTQGSLVKLDPANQGKILLAGAGDVVVGIVAQDVIPLNVDNFKLDSVTHKARVGDKVGVYFGGGEYITDMFSGNITVPGTPLYAGAGGKFSTTASGNVLAYAETIGNSANGDKIRIKVVGF